MLMFTIAPTEGYYEKKNSSGDENLERTMHTALPLCLLPGAGPSRAGMFKPKNSSLASERTHRGSGDTLHDQEFSLPTMQRDVLHCQIQADPIAPPMANLDLGSQPLTEAKDPTACSKS